MRRVEREVRQALRRQRQEAVRLRRDVESRDRGVHGGPDERTGVRPEMDREPALLVAAHERLAAAGRRDRGDGRGMALERLHRQEPPRLGIGLLAHAHEAENASLCVARDERLAADERLEHRHRGRVAVHGGRFRGAGRLRILERNAQDLSRGRPDAQGIPVVEERERRHGLAAERRREILREDVPRFRRRDAVKKDSRRGGCRHGRGAGVLLGERDAREGAPGGIEREAGKRADLEIDLSRRTLERRVPPDRRDDRGPVRQAEADPALDRARHRGHGRPGALETGHRQLL